MFTKRLHEALSFLADYPMAAQVLHDDLRAKPIRGYPMSVHYRIVGKQVRVLAIADQRGLPENHLV